MSEHAVLAPSSAPVWGVCSGSVSAQMGAPDIDSQESKEGTAAHWVGSDCLENWQSPDLRDLECVEWLGKTAPNGVVIDDKMVEGAQLYVDDVLVIARKHYAIDQLRIEHRVHMPRVHPQNWGTLDASLWLPKENTLYLWDYKHGHRAVEAEANLQMVDYLEGLSTELELDDLTTKFVLRIVQPYSYHSSGVVSEWRGTLSDLRSYVNQLHFMANEALTNPRFTAGKHCRDCKAVGVCATARRHLYAWADYVNEPYVIDVMSGQDLAAERNLLRGALATGKARLEAIEAELEHRIKQGDAGTGLTVEASESTRWYWNIPAEQAVALCAQFAVDASKPDVMTPKQAMSKVDAAMRGPFEQTIKAVLKPPTRTLKLIPAKDSITTRAFAPTKG